MGKLTIENKIRKVKGKSKVNTFLKASCILNTLNITALSEDISYEEALELAAGIAKLWNLKINAEIENNDNSGKEERAMPLRNYFNSGFCSKMQKG